MDTGNVTVSTVTTPPVTPTVTPVTQPHTQPHTMSTAAPIFVPASGHNTTIPPLVPSVLSGSGTTTTPQLLPPPFVPTPMTTVTADEQWIAHLVDADPSYTRFLWDICLLDRAEAANFMEDTDQQQYDTIFALSTTPWEEWSRTLAADEYRQHVPPLCRIKIFVDFLQQLSIDTSMFGDREPCIYDTVRHHFTPAICSVLSTKARVLLTSVPPYLVMIPITAHTPDSFVHMVTPPTSNIRPTAPLAYLQQQQPTVLAAPTPSHGGIQGLHGVPYQYSSTFNLRSADNYPTDPPPALRPETAIPRHNYYRKLTPPTTKWNGEQSTWYTFKKSFEAWLFMHTLDYTLDNEFWTAYNRGGYNAARHTSRLPHQHDAVRLTQDARQIFGALLHCTINTDKYHGQLQQHQGDGIRAWYGLVALSEEGTNITTYANTIRLNLANEFDEQTTTPLAFIDERVSNYSKLDTIRTSHPFSGVSTFSVSEQIHDTLIKFGREQAALLYDIAENCIRERSEFSVFVMNARKKLSFAQYGNTQIATRRARLAQQEQPDTTVQAMYANRYPDRSPDPYFIQREALGICNLLIPNFLDLYKEKRTEMRDQRRAGHPPNVTTTAAPTPAAIPRQYSNPEVRQGNLVLDESTTPHDDEDDADAWLHYAYLATLEESRSVNTVSTFHSLPTDNYVNPIPTNGHHLTISDGGADSWVLGMGWYVLTQHPQVVNIVGFDRTATQMTNLPLVDAAAVYTTRAGTLILGIVHQAVLHEGNTLTLASEYQSRQSGNVFDSVARCHKHWDGSDGEQAIKLTSSASFDGSTCIIDLHLHNSLMTCEHRIPTQYELVTLPRFFLTPPPDTNLLPRFFLPGPVLTIPRDDSSDTDRLHDGSNLPTRHIHTVSVFYSIPLEIHVNLIRSDGHHLTISDGGADSWVLGKGWYVLFQHERQVNLVGFDRKAARKFGLPTVDAATVYTTRDGSCILGIVHHAVLNDSNSITLASEYQSRMCGNIIDSVARCHKHWDGSAGEQAFKLTYPASGDETSCILDLHLNGALMTCEHRAP